MSVGRSVGLSVCPPFPFRWFASSFCIFAPAQSRATDTVAYPAPSTAPALTLPLLPNPRDLCRFAYPALFSYATVRSYKIIVSLWLRLLLFVILIDFAHFHTLGFVFLVLSLFLEVRDTYDTVLPPPHLRGDSVMGPETISVSFLVCHYGLTKRT